MVFAYEKFILQSFERDLVPEVFIQIFEDGFYKRIFRSRTVFLLLRRTDFFQCIYKFGKYALCACFGLAVLLSDCGVCPFEEIMEPVLFGSFTGYDFIVFVVEDIQKIHGIDLEYIKQRWTDVNGESLMVCVPVDFAKMQFAGVDKHDVPFADFIINAFDADVSAAPFKIGQDIGIIIMQVRRIGMRFALFDGVMDFEMRIGVKTFLAEIIIHDCIPKQNFYEQDYKTYRQNSQLNL